MSEITSISSRFQETTCLLCEAGFRQTNINGNWWPKDHPGCPNAPADPREVERQKNPELVAQIAERERRQARELRAVALSTPPLYRNVTLENFECPTPDHRTLLNRANDYVGRWAGDPMHFPQVVLMLGSPGTGKGHIAWSIAKHVAENMEPGSVKVMNCSDIIRDLRQSWSNGDGESEIKRLRFYRELSLLVIDEVSKHALYGEPSRHLYDLINHRQEWLRPTILTSNEDVNGISELLGKALVSRAAGWDAVWQFAGEDYRVKSRKLRAVP